MLRYLVNHFPCSNLNEEYWYNNIVYFVRSIHIDDFLRYIQRFFFDQPDIKIPHKEYSIELMLHSLQFIITYMVGKPIGSSLFNILNLLANRLKLNNQLKDIFLIDGDQLLFPKIFNEPGNFIHRWIVCLKKWISHFIPR